jgi:DHA2 family multidrug resistance protein
LSNLATASQPPSEQAGASAIFNVMRNLGGSIGIAALSTFITFREQYHFSIIGNWLTQPAHRAIDRRPHPRAGIGDAWRGPSDPHAGGGPGRRGGAP